MSAGPSYRVLTHPFFIGLILSVAILSLWRPDISTFRVEEVGHERMDPTRNLYYFDLDQDGNSEEVAIDHHPPLLKIMITSQNHIVGQYNLRSQLLNQDFINAGDYNSDGKKELYLFTMRQDSLFISIFDPFGNEGTIQLERPFFYNDTITFDTDVPQVYYLGFMEPEQMENRSLYFAANTGFSKRPRGFFKYDIQQDQLTESPLSAAPVNNPLFACNDEGHFSCILFSTSATDNYGSPFPYQDHSAWLMMLDWEMDFVFDPVEFPGSPASLQVMPFQVNGQNELLLFYHRFGKDTVHSSLLLYSPAGKPLQSKAVFPQDRYFDYLTMDHSGMNPVICLMDARQRRVRRFGPDLKEMTQEEIPALLAAKPICRYDLDNDGGSEYFFYGEKIGTTVVFREGLTEPVEIDPDKDQYPHHISMVHAEGMPRFYMQYSGDGIMLHYRRNPLHILTYPLIMGIYLGISLLVLMIYRLQKYRAEERFRTERKINELQIRNLKNQIDPHFTFNILNSIGSMYARETNKNRAYDLFVRYSNLLRYALQKSDKVTVSLEEELNFVQNYIQLEQSRHTPVFSWEIRVEEQVDRQKLIPRMIIHTFVENAIKHGISHAREKGNLLITVSRIMVTSLAGDVLFAAVGRATGATVVTRDVRGFELFDRVTVESY